MARPRSANFEVRQQQLLDAAARLFAKRGFDAVSIADLADACHVSKSLLYHYYPSKEALLQVLLEKYMRRLADAVDTVTRLPGSDRAKLERMAHELIGIYSRDHSSHLVLLNDRRRLSSEQRREIDELERRTMSAISLLLEHINPRLRVLKSMERLTELLWMGMLHWTALYYHEQKQAPLGEVAAIASGIFAVGLASLDIRQIRRGPNVKSKKVQDSLDGDLNPDGKNHTVRKSRMSSKARSG